MFFNNIKKNIFQRDIIFLVISCLWVTFNVYFLPFVIWTLGITRPWFIIKGLVPYRDFTWIRTPFDIYLLSFWYRLFGVRGESYQLFVYFLLIAITVSLFFILRSLFAKIYLFVFLFYNLFSFLLFINTQEGEIVLALLNLLIFASILAFLKTHAFKWAIIAGFIGGLIYITKQNSIIVALVSFFTLVLDVFSSKKSSRHLLSGITAFLLGTSIPIACFLLFFASKNALGDYLYYTIFFIFKVYVPSQSSVSFTFGDGFLIALGFLSLLVPFIVFWRKTKLKIQVVFLISLSLLASLFSLLPSLLSYRAFPAFGFATIVVGYDLLILLEGKRKSFLTAQKLLVIFSFVIFVIFVFGYIKDYVNFIQQNSVKNGQFITDFGGNEEKIAQWVRFHTDKKDKIIDYGNEIIYYTSNRLPANKYMEPLPSVLTPYDKSSNVFIKNPPKVVIYDELLLNSFKELRRWPFIDFMKKNYRVVATFDNSINIYEYGLK